MSTGVDGWCGWRQLIQCIWGGGGLAEYKHTDDGSCKKCRGGYLSDCRPYTYTYPRGTAITCNQSNSLPSCQLVLFLNLKPLLRSEWTWKTLFVDAEPRALCRHASPPFSQCPVSSLVAYLDNASAVKKVQIHFLSSTPAHIHANWWRKTFTSLKFSSLSMRVLCSTGLEPHPGNDI